MNATKLTSECALGSVGVKGLIPNTATAGDVGLVRDLVRVVVGLLVLLIARFSLLRITSLLLSLSFPLARRHVKVNVKGCG